MVFLQGCRKTSSKEVGIGIYRDFSKTDRLCPIILELGGKNAAIVSRRADLDDAASGILRSAFGLQGQKCSACSRVLVEAPVCDALLERLVLLTEKMIVGDPTERNVYLGPVINENAFHNFHNHIRELGHAGRQ